jgi:hypothetical protein
VCDLVKENSSLALAVAYWGAGAFEKLGISGDKEVRILCDLLSLGCNPYEIEKALAAPYAPAVKVRHVPRLHAKVYLSEEAVIVGSANASTNGLGDHPGANVEAAIHTSDGSASAGARTWFENIWGSDDLSTKLTSTLIEQAKRLPRPPSPNASFLVELIRNTSWFGKRVHLIYVDDLAEKSAKDVFRTIAKNHYSEKDRLGWKPNEEPFYQSNASKKETDEQVAPGDYIINCAYKNTPVSSIKEPGTVSMEPRHPNDCIVLLNDNLKAIMHLPFPGKERGVLFRAVKRHLDLSNRPPNARTKAKREFFHSVDKMDPALRRLIEEELENAMKG